jgi:hypothetical protein
MSIPPFNSVLDGLDSKIKETQGWRSEDSKDAIFRQIHSIPHAK